MTTIAFDGKTLAADRGTHNGDVINETTKLFDIQLCDEARDRMELTTNHIWYAAAGYGNWVGMIKKWMKEGGSIPEYPKENHVVGLIVEIETGYCFELGDTLTTIRYERVPAATGGGHEMALGAMLAGADAKKAIEIVASRSSMAWGGIDFRVLSE